MSKGAAADDGDSSGGGGDDSDGRVFLLKPQWCALLNQYSGGWQGRGAEGADCWGDQEGALCRRAAPLGDGRWWGRAASAAAATME